MTATIKSPLSVAPEEIEGHNLLKGKKVSVPEGFDRILQDWTFVVRHWNEKADEMLVYKRFFPGHNVAQLRADAAKLARKLEKLAE